MFEQAKALIGAHPSLEQIAAELRLIRELYEMELRERGIYRVDKSVIGDEVDISYGAKEKKSDDEDEW